ncbi:MAG: hypothetical protein IPP55_19135 [Anaerolineales bacterium]|nr:hypothetical protein [Anaerolineales bacterium]
MNTTILSTVVGIGGMFGWKIYDFLGGIFAKQIGAFKSLFWSHNRLPVIFLRDKVTKIQSFGILLRLSV